MNVLLSKRSTGLSLMLPALLVAGCLSAPSAAPPRAPAGSDPAARAFAQCGPKVPEEREACYERILVAMVEQEGVEAAMETLDRLGALDPEMRLDGHVYAHAIGLGAYTTAEEVGETFARCTPIYQSGCYHGVIQAYFVDLAGPRGQGRIDARAVNALCQDHRGEEGSRWLLFHCAHGLGHGLTMLYAHHLPRALEGCDLLGDLWERGACYGGAFMENVVNATVPHHPATASLHGAGPHGAEHGHRAAHAHHDADAHHAHSDAAPSPPFKALDPEDPHYPCSVLDLRYQIECYKMQTSVILFHNNYDFAAATRVCDEAPELVRTTCYQSLGRDINAHALQNHAKTIELCALGNPRYQPWCYIGVAKNLIDRTANAEDGLAYCRAVPGELNKIRCYEAVGEQIWVLERDPARQEALCRQAEDPFVEACLSGAWLVARREVEGPTP